MKYGTGTLPPCWDNVPSLTEYFFLRLHLQEWVGWVLPSMYYTCYPINIGTEVWRTILMNTASLEYNYNLNIWTDHFWWLKRWGDVLASLLTGRIAETPLTQLPPGLGQHWTLNTRTKKPLVVLRDVYLPNSI